MKLDRGIEILTTYLTEGEAPCGVLDDALQLGIEALKEIKHTRQNSQKPAYRKLPSETEE